MKKLKVISGFLVAGFLVFVFVICIDKLAYAITIGHPGTDVEKGQMWVGVLQEKNPFEKAIYDTIKVLDVSDGYSLVYRNCDTVVLENDMVKYKRRLSNEKD